MAASFSLLCRAIVNGACWRKSLGRRCTRRRSALCHQPRAREAPGRDGRQSRRRYQGLDAETLKQKLADADIAFARVNDVAALARHPHLRRITVGRRAGRSLIRRRRSGAVRVAPLRSCACARRAHRESAGGIYGRPPLRRQAERRESDGHRLHRSRQHGRAHGAPALEAGHRVVVYDTRQEAIGNLAALGAVRRARRPKSPTPPIRSWRACRRRISCSTLRPARAA